MTLLEGGAEEKTVRACNSSESVVIAEISEISCLWPKKYAFFSSVSVSVHTTGKTKASQPQSDWASARYSGLMSLK